MKKFSLFVLCTCISISFSFGQTLKGTKYWLADFGIYGNKGNKTTSSNSPTTVRSDKTESSNGFSCSLSIGKFLRNNVANGLKANYHTIISNGTNTNTGNSYKEYYSNNETIELGYFISRFISINSQFHFYGELNPNASYYYYLYRYDNLEENKENNYRIALRANVGVRYIFKNNLFIDMNTSLGSIGYNWATNKDFYKYSSFGLNSNLNLSNFSIGIGKSF
jgi:hypothetical protein